MFLYLNLLCIFSVIIQFLVIYMDFTATLLLLKTQSDKDISAQPFAYIFFPTNSCSCFFCFHLTILINSSPWFELPWEYEETCGSPSTYPKQQQSCNSLSFPYSFWPRPFPIPLRGYSSTKSFHWSHFLQFSFYQQFWQLNVWLQHQWQ